MNEQTHACVPCHGTGTYSCDQGCHTVECDECEGTGLLTSDDEPVRRDAIDI